MVEAADSAAPQLCNQLLAKACERLARPLSGAANATGGCALGEPLEGTELRGCVIDACRARPTLEAAAAACGELGAACGGVVRDQSRGGYELRAAGAHPPSARAQRCGRCLRVGCQRHGGRSVCALLGAGGRGQVGVDAAGAARLLAEQHKCVLPADAISLAAADAPTTVATAAAEGGARSAGAPTSAELCADARGGDAGGVVVAAAAGASPDGGGARRADGRLVRHEAAAGDVEELTSGRGGGVVQG